MRIVKEGKPPKVPEYHVCEKLPPAKNYNLGTIVQADCGHYYIVTTSDFFWEPYWDQLFWRNIWQYLFDSGFTSMEVEDEARD